MYVCAFTALENSALGTVMESDLHFCRRIYQYLPSELLDQCLGRLTAVQAPRYNETVTFQMRSAIILLDLNFILCCAILVRGRRCRLGSFFRLTHTENGHFMSFLVSFFRGPAAN
jgi:hypothetical protein